MSATLYTFTNNFRTNKILIAAEYSGHKVTVDPKFVVGVSDKSPEFLKKFPFGKIPAYESGDVKLFETNAIAYYVGNAQTRGADSEPEVLQWISFADNVIQPAACTWVYPTMGILQYNKQNTEKAKSDLKNALTALDSHLSTRTFLVGERVTQADISLACTFCMLYEHVMEPAFRDPFGNVNRWFTTLINQPEFKTVLGDVNLCTKMAQFDAKKFNEIHGKGDKKGKQNKNQSGGDGDKKSKPKETKSAEKKETAAEPAALKPKKDPWAVYPKIDNDIDSIKISYSNDKSKGHEDSIKAFWAQFNSDTHSLWHSSYSYNEDFTFPFMVCNLVNGFFQRIEKMRKHTFAWMCVWTREEKPKCALEGLWLWRGDRLAFELSEDWQDDYEFYKWRKLDPTSEEDRKLVDFYLAVQEGDRKGDYELDSKLEFK